MNNILVILEQKEEPKSALDRAVLIAQKMNANIHVLICCYQELNWFTDIFDMLENKRLQDLIIEKKQLWWQEYVKAYENTVTITHEVVWSKYFVDTILTHCKTHHYDFYVKKGHRSESILYTPSDWLLFRQSRTPTYIMVEEQPKPWKSILVALDLTATSNEKRNLNKKLLPFAKNLAEKMSLDIHYCFAIALPQILTDTGFVDVDEYSEKVAVKARENAAKLLKDYHVPPENLHIQIGTPYKVITNIAQAEQTNLIIIGSMGNKLSGKVIGNTCEDVLHITQKDVIVIGL